MFDYNCTDFLKNLKEFFNKIFCECFSDNLLENSSSIESDSSCNNKIPEISDNNIDMHNHVNLIDLELIKVSQNILINSINIDSLEKKIHELTDKVEFCNTKIENIIIKQEFVRIDNNN